MIILAVFMFSSIYAFASDCRIVETSDKIEAICEGTPSTANRGQSQAPSTPRLARINFLSSEIDRLSKEGEAIMKLIGKESIEDIRTKRALAAAKYRQMELYYNEIRSLRKQGDIELQALKSKVAEDNRRLKDEYKRQTGKSYR